jgi:hypothetical protein
MLPAAGAVGFDGLVGLGNCMYIFIYVHKHIFFWAAGMGQSILAGISEIFKNLNISQTPAIYPLRTHEDGVCQRVFRWGFR